MRGEEVWVRRGGSHSPKVLNRELELARGENQ